MIPFLFHSLFYLCSCFSVFASAQSSTDSGYIGYSLSSSGDPDSVIYSTSSTPTNESTTNPEPDVYLNATVHVGEIDITVSNLTAKINLDAKVAQLLQFNAGVDASINRVSLLIQNVSANVVLEARLENLVLMIDDVLNSLDLNPVLATIGQDLGNIVSTTTGALDGDSSGTDGTVARRSYKLANNILYSVNNYSGNTHTNRILTQSGSIVDEFLDDDGNTHGQQVVGDYLHDMTFNGYSQNVIKDGQSVRQLEYIYSPFNGLSVVSAIYINAAEVVVATEVLSETSGGGSSTVGDL